MGEETCGVGARSIRPGVFAEEGRRTRREKRFNAQGDASEK